MSDLLTRYPATIPMTEYRLPNGQQYEIYFPATQEAADHAELILAAGYHFECELLKTGAGSFTIGDRDGDYQICLIFNTTPMEDRPQKFSDFVLKQSVQSLNIARDAQNKEEDNDNE